jgi:apolipoprotein D and lipocalin family protein
VVNRPSSRLAPSTLVAGAILLAAAMARAGAPAPVRPVPADLYSGRWYEIARTPNGMQKDCEGPTSDFEGWSAGTFVVVNTCHKGGPRGETRVIRAKAKILTPRDNTRFRMSFFGGLVHQEYWIIDHADDGSWALMATPGGNYVWLLSRRPAMAPSSLAAALARAVALGYAPSRLVYPAQATG